MPVIPDGRQSVNVTANKTLTAADSGLVQNVIGSWTVTLPATATGLSFMIRNGGSAATTGGPLGAVTDGASTITVAPQAADGFTGNGFTAAVNKTALSTLGNIGDEFAVEGTGTTGATGWVVRSVRGTWTRQP